MILFCYTEYFWHKFGSWPIRAGTLL